MASQPVSPLRIHKGNGTSSPSKLPVVTSKPLFELSPMAIRRNSPSFPQSKGKIINGDTPPASSSPFSLNTTSSPRLFWQGRDPNSPAREKGNPHEMIYQTAPAKRSSIENLKKASRVKNSSMFAMEQNKNYDPSKPSILDGRPTSTQGFHSDAEARGAEDLRKENMPPNNSISTALSLGLADSFEDSFSESVAPLSPSRTNVSPVKSSLSKKTGASLKKGGFDPDGGIWEDDDLEEKRLPEGRGLHRHAKSVTFDQAPPQINEYEMTTPDPSSVASGSREGSYESMEDEEEEEYSFDRGSSMDHDDSFDASLEDTDKTPVVLPEDWRFMSPENANTELSQHEEDVFDDDYGSPAPTANPGFLESRQHQTSVNSVDSNGQPRPLPPLPPSVASQMHPSAIRDSLSGTIERISGGQRCLPSPPAAAMISKSDIRRMSNGSLSLEDRLRLMMPQEQDAKQAEAEKQRERRMRRAGSKDPSPIREQVLDHAQADQTDFNHQNLADTNLGARISREAILRHMRSGQDLDEMSSDVSMFDPDVPIPSLEDPTRQLDDPIAIKEEDIDENELYSIPDLYSHRLDVESDLDDDLNSQYSQPSLPKIPMTTAEDGQETPRAHTPAGEPEKKPVTRERMSLPEFNDFGRENSFNLGLDTYMTPPIEPEATSQHKKAMGGEPEDLPDLAALRNSIQRPYTPVEQLERPRIFWDTEEGSERLGTPNSVIRHPVSNSVSPDIEDLKDSTTENASQESMDNLRTRTESVIPDPSTHEGLRSPFSASINPKEKIEAENQAPQPHDILGEAQQHEDKAQPKKRVSSLVQLEISRDQSDEGLGFGLEKEFDRVVEAQKVAFELSLQRLYFPFNGRFPSFELPDAKDSGWSDLTRNIPYLAKPDGPRALQEPRSAYAVPFPSFESNFANRNARRQRGYLMRQNTKVVVASERVSHDEARNNTTLNGSIPDRISSLATEANEVQPSSRKTSQPTWTAEPWNGKSRRKSIRVGGEKTMPKRKPVEGAVPPLPGQSSNVQDGLGAVAEDELAEEEAEEFEDGAERGRLFVKVVGVKDLQLPFPQHERTHFALTLDNGLHCVTTAWLDLARSAPIGQEFELVVLNELEFQLTLQMKLEQPKIERPLSPSKPPTSPKKQGALGRLFGSPKKRKELESKVQQESQTSRRPITPPSAYELVQGLVGKDGSFARAYVALNEHEKHAYGRPYTVDIACFNEWAMEEANVGSSRSKKGATQLQQRPPYEIGKLELQLLYIPKPKGTADEDMPKSMNSAVRALREAEDRMQQQASLKEFEGHLSQQGGDCPFWRRRFFKLVGPKLTAYHESTLQPRATINLAKATKLIDDKSILTQRETSAKGGGRRKSAFAEEEEGYMFVEEGFRIRFANGEVIDFYADSTPQKEEWMKILSQVVGKSVPNSGMPVKGWVDMVLKREKSSKTRQTKLKPEAMARNNVRETQVQVQPQVASRALQPVTGSNGLPSPTRPSAIPRPGSAHTRTESYQQEVSSRSQANSPMKTKVSREERNRKTKSMAF